MGSTVDSISWVMQDFKSSTVVLKALFVGRQGFFGPGAPGSPVRSRNFRRVQRPAEETIAAAPQCVRKGAAMIRMGAYGYICCIHLYIKGPEGDKMRSYSNPHIVLNSDSQLC